MRIILILIIFILFGCTLFNQTNIDSKYQIGFLNLNRYGQSSKDTDLLISIITNFDAIGFVEIISNKEFLDLQKELNKKGLSDWHVLVSIDHYGNYSVYQEYYGLIYHQKVFEEVEALGAYPEDETNPYERPPFCFALNNNQKSLKFILCHIYYGDSSKIDIRRKEIQTLPLVLKYFKKGEEVVLIAGDFNLEVSDSSFESLYKEGFTNILSTNDKTTIGATTLISAYDNVFFNPAQMIQYRGTVYSNQNINFTDYKSKLSDHLPIVIEFE